MFIPTYATINIYPFSLPLKLNQYATATCPPTHSGTVIK